MKRTINLIPEEFYLRRRLRLKLVAWGAAFLVVCPGLFGLYLWEKGRCAGLERRCEQLQAQRVQRQEMAARLEKLHSVRDALRAKQAAIRALLGQQASTLVLAELDRCLERGVWVTSLEITGGGGQEQSKESAPGGAGREAAEGRGGTPSFRMRGYAPSHRALARMLPRLGELATLRRPRLVYAKAASSRSAVEFEIEAELRCGLTRGA